VVTSEISVLDHYYNNGVEIDMIEVDRTVVIKGTSGRATIYDKIDKTFRAIKLIHNQVTSFDMKEMEYRYMEEGVKLDALIFRYKGGILDFYMQPRITPAHPIIEERSSVELFYKYEENITYITSGSLRLFTQSYY
jgi:hypothetical protein